MSVLNIYYDTQTGQLLDSPDTTSAATLPPFYQGDKRSTNIFPLDPTGLLTTPYTTADLSASQLKVAICGGAGLPTGTIGGPTPVAFTNTDGWTWVTDHFEGQLDCNTQEYADFLGAGASKPSTFEIEETDSDGPTRVQFPCLCKAQVNEESVVGIVNFPAYFVSTSTPTGSIPIGALWLNPSGFVLKYWDGSSWDAIT